MNKTKRQLRAEAVERLKSIPPMDTSEIRYVRAILGSVAGMTAQDVTRELIDLLEDDDMDSAVCVQKCPNDELPEGDAIEHARRRWKYRPEDGDEVVMNEYNCNLLMSDLDAIADMIERDYVRREKYENTVKMCNDMHSDVMHVAELQEQVDVLREQLGTMRDVARDFRDERDEWKAKAEGTSKVRVGQSNLEWLMENDRDALIAMAATHCDCEHCAYCETEKCVEDVRYGENDCYGGCCEWLMAPHVDDRGQNADMSQKDADCVRSEPEMSEIDEYELKGWTRATPYEDYEPHSTRENLGSEPSTLEDFAGKGSEVDSREKLEADVLKATKRTGTANQEDIWRWLNRQVSITERHWMEIVGASANCNLELTNQIAELQDQLESAHAKNRALKAHISKMQEGRHGWHVKGKELQGKVDALTQANADYREEWHRVCRERDNLQRKLHESNREREQLRKQLGIAIDHAHDMIALVSVDNDEGLA